MTDQQQQHREKVHRPRFPMRKPVKGDATVIDFISKGAREVESFVILASEPDLFSVMLRWLNDKHHKFVKVEGGYKMNDGSGKFVVENAVLVTRKIAIEIWIRGWLDTQESVLHLYHKDILGRYKAELCFLNDVDRVPLDLGLLVQTTPERALNNPDGYTYKPEADAYYITVHPHGATT